MTTLSEVVASVPLPHIHEGEDIVGFGRRCMLAAAVAASQWGMQQVTNQAVVIHVPDLQPQHQHDEVPPPPPAPPHQHDEPAPPPQEKVDNRQRSKAQSDKIFAQLGDLGWDYKSEDGKNQLLGWINEVVLQLKGTDQIVSTKDLTVTQAGKVIEALDKEIATFRAAQAAAQEGLGAQPA